MKRKVRDLSWKEFRLYLKRYGMRAEHNPVTGGWDVVFYDNAMRFGWDVPRRRMLALAMQRFNPSLKVGR